MVAVLLASGQRGFPGLSWRHGEEEKEDGDRQLGGRERLADCRARPFSPSVWVELGRSRSAVWKGKRPVGRFACWALQEPPRAPASAPAAPGLRRGREGAACFPESRPGAVRVKGP